MNEHISRLVGEIVYLQAPEAWTIQNLQETHSRTIDSANKCSAANKFQTVKTLVYNNMKTECKTPMSETRKVSCNTFETEDGAFSHVASIKTFRFHSS